jgi:5-methylcytosine-specific restriction endonuclease McrA
LAGGQVSLVTLAMVAGILAEANKDEILSSIRGKSQREVERIVSTYRPRPVVRDQVRAVSVVVPAGSFSTPSAGSELPAMDRVGNAAAGPTPGQPSTPSAGSASKARVVQKHLIQFAAGEAFVQKLDEMRALLSAKMPGASLEQIFEATMDAYLDRHSPKRRAERRVKPPQQGLQQRPKSGACEISRHIPAAVRAEIFARDGGRCTYVAPGGTRCGSTHALQIDHVTPFARGGPNTAANLRLLCAKHNRLEAERTYGFALEPRFKRRRDSGET